MPPRPERFTIVPPVDPEGDQTAGYHPDGSPVTVSDPDAQQVEGIAMVTGSVRKRRVGSKGAGIQPRQLRRGEMVVSRGEDGKTRTERYIPSVHGDPPPVSLSYEKASEQIDPADERRSLRATAMHERHTNLHNPIPAPPTPNQRRGTLRLGGFFTLLGEEYAQESGATYEEPQSDTDDAPDIPW